MPGVTSVGNVSYETRIFVTNRTAQQRTVKSLQLGSNVDGTKRAGTTPASTAVGSAQTVVLKPNGGTRGLLELDAPAGVRYSARLVGTGAAAGIGVELPVITSENMGHSGDTLVVQTLRGTATVKTEIVMVNLSQSAKTCSAHVIRANGTPTDLHVTSIPLQPLSHVAFSNVFALLNPQVDISDARVEVSCTGTFYAFAQMTDSTTGEFAIALPSGESESTLEVPGVDEPANPNPSPSCGDGVVCFTYGGLVHTSTKANPERTIVVKPPTAAYRSVRVRFDFELNGWHPPASAAHGLLYMVRNGRNKDMYANVFLKGPGANSLTLRHGFNQTHGEKAKVTRGFTPQMGVRYTLEYVFDPTGKALSLTISRGGTVLAQMDHKPNVNKVHIEPGDLVTLGLSNPDPSNKVEPATIGAKWFDLRVEFVQ
jgi:hypothetical protein